MLRKKKIKTGTKFVQRFAQSFRGLLDRMLDRDGHVVINDNNQFVRRALFVRTGGSDADPPVTIVVSWVFQLFKDPSLRATRRLCSGR